MVKPHRLRRSEGLWEKKVADELLSEFEAIRAAANQAVYS